jgi:hypothetical protein
MAIIIANHRVKDFDQWKPYYDGDKTRRQDAGIKELRVGRKADDPNDVYLIWDVNDPTQIMKMRDDPDLRQLMEKSGVISDITFVVLDGV